VGRDAHHRPGIRKIQQCLIERGAIFVSGLGSFRRARRGCLRARHRNQKGNKEES